MANWDILKINAVRKRLKLQKNLKTFALGATEDIIRLMNVDQRLTLTGIPSPETGRGACRGPNRQ